MAKRKRGDADKAGAVAAKKPAVSATQTNGSTSASSTHKTVESPTTSNHITIQIVTGSYERVLHGVTATIPLAPIATSKEASEDVETVKFADTFLFTAHASAIRCLALSPPSSSTKPTQPPKVILASGSTDERINLYHLSATPPPPPPTSKSGIPLPIPTLAGNVVVENPKNRELGSLLHHSSSINALCFPSRSKLLSAAEDNTIAVTRTRDWTVLSTIKAPTPVAHGRPSGDTAPLGGTPAGVNDFAVHSSMKLMLSVGKGEKCMRLWNLLTGKKAGVLNFSKEMLQGVGEGKWGSGEGRRVVFDEAGEEFAVGFERGAVVFGLDSKPRCRISPSPATKVHQLHYLPSRSDTSGRKILAVSTENGRIIFYSTAPSDSDTALPQAVELGSITSPDSQTRIKDFTVLSLPTDAQAEAALLIIAASSDGAVRVFLLDRAAISPSARPPGPKNVSRCLGTLETGARITCLAAFVMQPPAAQGEDRAVGDAVDGDSAASDQSDA